MSGPEAEQNVDVVRARRAFEQRKAALFTDTSYQMLGGADVSLSQYRPAAARGPGDEVMELAAIHRLPAPLKGFGYFGSQFALHGSLLLRGQSLEQMCTKRSQKKSASPVERS